MDFGALPPEINSGRMYLGPGPATLLAASAGWDALAAELNAAADGYQSVIASLTDESWLGPTSMSMAAAVAPYMSWMRATAAQCEQAASQATAAAAAYETAYAMTVPPPLIAANRAQLMTLIATNLLGQNTPAIMATEAEYSEMWAQDATAMYNYAASSASAVGVQHLRVAATNDQSGRACRPGRRGRADGGHQGRRSTSTQLMSSVPPSPAESFDARVVARGSRRRWGHRGVTGIVGTFQPAQRAVEPDRHIGQNATKSASTGAGDRIRPGLEPRISARTGMRPPGFRRVRRGLRCGRRWAAMVPAWVPTAADSVSTGMACAGFRGRGLDYGGRGGRGPGSRGRPGKPGRSGRRRVGEPGPSGLARHLVGAAELGRRGVGR